MVEPAFPCTVEREAPLGGFHIFPGMTLRDWFAGQALAGTELDAALAGSITDQQIAEDCALLARVMYQIADAMLAERSK